MRTQEGFPLLSLPAGPLYEVLRHCYARSLAMLEVAASATQLREPGRRLGLLEEVAREKVLERAGGSLPTAERFRRRSWRERLHLEEAAGAGFDRAFSEGGGFQFQFSPDGGRLQSVQLAGMGPKLLVSDASTADQPVLHWQLRVRGNTAVEFGVIPADLPPSHTALHKCQAAPGCAHRRAQGFCSQITAGSLLPLKAPVMRGTLMDIVAQRGHLEVILRYPEDAREISWQNGQPVQRPYRGPSQLRLEQDFPPDFDVRLAVTSWARGHFDVLHDGFAFDPAWPAEAAAAEQAAAAAQRAEQQAAAALAQQQQEQLQQAEAQGVMLLAEEVEVEEAAAALPLQAVPGEPAMHALPANEQEEQALLPAAAFGAAPAADWLAADAAAAADHFGLLPEGGEEDEEMAAALHEAPAVLAAAAVVAAGPDPTHLAVLHQLHALQAPEPAALPDEHGEAEAWAAAADGAGPAGTTQPLPAPAAPPAAACPHEGSPAPALCHSPSLDGQLPVPDSPLPPLD